MNNYKLLLILVFFSISAVAEARNVIRWASQGDALTMDPHAANELPTVSAVRKVYDTLVSTDKDLQIVPWLATSWDAVTPTSWEFELRRGVQWHDGSPFTAKDVKFSLDRARSEHSDFKEHIGSIQDIQIIDDHRVRVETEGPNPLLPIQLTTVFIMSEAWSKKHGVTKLPEPNSSGETHAVRHAMGTGPFVLKSRKPDIRTVLTKNTHWWGLAHYPHDVDELIHTPISNKATRISALISGELDFVLDPPVQDLERVKRTPGIKLEQTAQDRTIFFGLNQAKEVLSTSDVKEGNPFRDKRVRQAMYHAIDAQAIHQKIMRGYSVPAGLITAPSVRGHSEELDERDLAHDPDAARRLLAEAGYADGFSVQLDCPNNRYVNDEAICQAVAAMLTKVGVRTKLSAQPKSQHFPKVTECETDDGKCTDGAMRRTDFYMLGWGVPTRDSHYVFSYLVKDSTWNATGFNNPHVTALIDKIGLEVDFEQRDKAVAEVWRTIKHETIYLPIHHQVVVWAMRDWIDIPVVADNDVRFIYSKISKH